MIDSLPEELPEQAGLLLNLPGNQGNLRRSISTCYYDQVAEVRAFDRLLTRAAQKRLPSHDRVILRQGRREAVV
jgi:hypothetical protein